MLILGQIHQKPTCCSYFQAIGHDKYKVLLYCTVFIGSSPSLPISQEEKRKDERIINELKIKVFGDYKKTLKNVEEKRDREIHNIKSTQNSFYLGS